MSLNLFAVECRDVVFKYMNVPFPEESVDPTFQIASIYSFHTYGKFSESSCSVISSTCTNSIGFGLFSKARNAAEILADNGRSDMDIYISEFNCYAQRTTENVNHAFFAGKHVMDEPSTASCLSSQYASILMRGSKVKSMSLHKLVQNRVTSSPSKVGKNGILYGNTVRIPFDISGSTKAAEIYRLLLAGSLRQDGSGGGIPVLKVNSTSHDFDKSKSRVTAWAVKDTRNLQSKVRKVYT